MYKNRVLAYTHIHIHSYLYSVLLQFGINLYDILVDPSRWGLRTITTEDTPLPRHSHTFRDLNTPVPVYPSSVTFAATSEGGPALAMTPYTEGDRDEIARMVANRYSSSTSTSPDDIHYGDDGEDVEDDNEHEQAEPKPKNPVMPGTSSSSSGDAGGEEGGLNALNVLLHREQSEASRLRETLQVDYIIYHITSYTLHLYILSIILFVYILSIQHLSSVLPTSTPTASSSAAMTRETPLAYTTTTAGATTIATTITTGGAYSATSDATEAQMDYTDTPTEREDEYNAAYNTSSSTHVTTSNMTKEQLLGRIRRLETRLIDKTNECRLWMNKYNTLSTTTTTTASMPTGTISGKVHREEGKENIYESNTAPPHLRVKKVVTINEEGQNYDRLSSNLKRHSDERDAADDDEQGHNSDQPRKKHTPERLSTILQRISDERERAAEEAGHNSDRPRKKSTSSQGLSRSSSSGRYNME